MKENNLKWEMRWITRLSKIIKILRKIKFIF